MAGIDCSDASGDSTGLIVLVAGQLTPCHDYAVGLHGVSGLLQALNARDLMLFVAHSALNRNTISFFEMGTRKTLCV